MTLNDLAHKHITDKWDECHNYCPIYESLFEAKRNEVMNLLEIGVETGGSIRMFRDYFPNAIIHGIDIVSCNDSGERTKGYIADQSKPEQLLSVIEQIGARLEIIIDDGSHDMNDILISLKTLYPHLKDGGIYVIEDVEHIRNFTEPLKEYNHWFAVANSPIWNSNLIIIRKP